MGRVGSSDLDSVTWQVQCSDILSQGEFWYCLSFIHRCTLDRLFFIIVYFMTKLYSISSPELYPTVLVLRQSDTIH
ncbi:hypothetical protein SERLA73DRAFT_182530 [Serpula lacrymans var. lacrymans S7.3]|uniref:Uncharacterized protein n=2 Tax=Serpula lacrymans var. lacrymans TaxID=341189 RepID=F8Q0F5_SERL3|nr:uncharacterized protein SERLADRAFT_469226 [Serpula lacrymans var. lacrymans S7.9]EGN97784.1 hypothetical protein SERLA73DRAFT_182530 [Serpula lacrymans var. lacrymans S7.3]EGO23377.1 hypothetical protein SERLADRAFT_469226 [Serpula lacrymans var. lacrymans S7.9]